MSENYIVSARKYRPQSFASVVGQSSLTRTLKNAISTGRLAQAYLFTGPRGVGKTTCARIFAKTINCENLTAEGEACGECASCRDFARGHSFNVTELDAASNNGVDHIRALTEQVNIPPQVGRYRVFIIDEVHMLSNQAFNAFLKTLEEPPAYAIFILATTEKNKVIPTILSRCQVYDFNRITDADISSHLRFVAEDAGIEAEDAALEVIARKADGALRDALSIFDQIAAGSGGKITYAHTLDNLNLLDYDYYFRFADAFNRGDAREALVLYKEVRDKGFDSLFFINGLASHLRNLLMAADKRTLPLLEVSGSIAERYGEQASIFSPKWYYKALELLSECDLNYRIATNKQLLTEIALIRLSSLREPAEAKPKEKMTISTPGPGAAPAKTAAPAPQPSAPQSQPSAPRAAAAPAARPTMRRPASASAPKAAPRTVRISSGTQESASESSTDSDDHRGERNTPITLDSLRDAWRKFIADNGDLHVVVGAMRRTAPVDNGNGRYTITVDNPAQQQQFEEAAPRLNTFMREALDNDSFTLTAIVSDAPRADAPLSPQEILKKVVEENPVLRNLISGLDVELM